MFSNGLSMLQMFIAVPFGFDLHVHLPVVIGTVPRGYRSGVTAGECHDEVGRGLVSVTFVRIKEFGPTRICTLISKTKLCSSLQVSVINFIDLMLAAMVRINEIFMKTPPALNKSKQNSKTLSCGQRYSRKRQNHPHK